MSEMTDTMLRIVQIVDDIADALHKMALAGEQLEQRVSALEDKLAEKEADA